MRSPAVRIVFCLAAALGLVLFFAAWPGESLEGETPLEGARPTTRDLDARATGALQPRTADDGVNSSRVRPEVAQEQTEARDSALVAPRRDDYGPFSSPQKVQQDAEFLCLAFVADSKAEYVEEQLGWRLGKKLVMSVPALALAPEGVEPDEVARERAGAVNLEYRAPITQAAERAFDLFQVSAKDYSRTKLVQLPRDASHQQRLAAEDPASRSVYSSSSMITAGAWKFHVEFYSADYPDLQRALLELERIRKQREEAVRVALGGK